ncbi:MAG: porphobilinogen synthase [Planctomycetes bacterium]|nr:porphobilinogen synthase [Planctomycetota bacterium]MBI3833855.1 porphobilinogen synthase [Planctomycetota bacterium]
MSFPKHRGRRLRSTPAVRALAGETRLCAADFIHPIFVVEEASAAGPIASMPGVSRLTLQQLDAEIERILNLGIRSVLLFGIPVLKDATASSALSDRSIVAAAIERIRKATDRLAIITDVCLCSYTDHGHCGVIKKEKVDNDATIELLAKVALVHAQAGAHVVAPSAMMDGQVAAIRERLDHAGFIDTCILSYAVKYASSFYGPFREAADSKPSFGDRRGYQMAPTNAGEALNEARTDLEEGADIIMVKPALPYLDVIRRVRDTFPGAPLVAYQVSGEYSMIKAAAERGWLDERLIAMEALTAIKRAGADRIITYFAPAASKWLAEMP